jgi:hypothetical protein
MLSRPNATPDLVATGSARCAASTSPAPLADSVAVEPKHVRSELAKAIVDLRGLRSTSFLRGMASAARACLMDAEPVCPYGRATSDMDAFWAGLSEGVEVIERLTVYRSDNTNSTATTRPQVQLGRSTVLAASPERAATPWEPDETELLIESYLVGTSVGDLAKTFSRTGNAIVWQLWSEAATSVPLLERLRASGHTRPLRGADLRNSLLAARWVSAFLRGSTKLMLRSGQEVTLDALLMHADGTLAAWAPDGHSGVACDIEEAAAKWMFNHPERWAGNEHW